MRRLARYGLVILCVLALASSSTTSFAAATADGKPCTHDHGANGTSHPHKHHGAGCLACCLGACLVIPDLPPRTFFAAVLFADTAVSYCESEALLDGRSIRPDPAPPRTSA
jgi:hypothetical protein